jgi:ring-1,2-phenylacetyl-CoA epoxidase subunit PaaD
VIDANVALPRERDVRVALAGIPDPELPVISIVDLGIIGDVAIGPEAIEVAILPTFVACPALDVIRSTIEDRLATEFAWPVTVRTTFDVPWTSERISKAGRAALLRAGIAPPADPADVRCPQCASDDVAMDSAFGPTQCRSLFFCRSCRQPFEAMKPV